MPLYLRLFLLIFLLGITIFASASFAHDNWISRGAFRNGAGEWCCGESDCFVVPNEQVKITSNGYRLYNSEIVPFSEAQTSTDGSYWRCKRPDGSRRCFFAPPQTD